MVMVITRTAAMDLMVLMEPTVLGSMDIIITGSLPYIVRVIGKQTKLILLKRMPMMQRRSK